MISILCGSLGLLLFISLIAIGVLIRMSLIQKRELKRVKGTATMSMEDIKAKKEEDYYGNEDYTYYDSIKPITINSPFIDRTIQ